MLQMGPISSLSSWSSLIWPPLLKGICLHCILLLGTVRSTLCTTIILLQSYYVLLVSFCSMRLLSLDFTRHSPRAHCTTRSSSHLKRFCRDCLVVSPGNEFVGLIHKTCLTYLVSALACHGQQAIRGLCVLPGNMIIPGSLSLSVADLEIFSTQKNDTIHAYYSCPTPFLNVATQHCLHTNTTQLSYIPSKGKWIDISCFYIIIIIVTG